MTTTLSEWRQQVHDELDARQAAEEKKKAEEQKKLLEQAREIARASAEKGAKFLADLGLVVDWHDIEEHANGATYGVWSVGDYLFKFFERGAGTKAQVYVFVSKASYPNISTDSFPISSTGAGYTSSEMRFFIVGMMNWLDLQCAEAEKEETRRAQKKQEEEARVQAKAEEEAARLEALKSAPVTSVEIPEFGGAFEAERVKDVAAGIARYANACDALPLAWRGKMRKRLNATLIDMVADFGAWAVRERTERALQDAAQGKQDKEGSEIE